MANSTIVWTQRLQGRRKVCPTPAIPSRPRSEVKPSSASSTQEGWGHLGRLARQRIRPHRRSPRRHPSPECAPHRDREVRPRCYFSENDPAPRRRYAWRCRDSQCRSRLTGEALKRTCMAAVFTIPDLAASSEFVVIETSLPEMRAANSRHGTWTLSTGIGVNLTSLLVAEANAKRTSQTPALPRISRVCCMRPKEHSAEASNTTGHEP